MSGESILDRDIFSDDANIQFANQDLEKVLQLVTRLDERLKNDEPDIANLAGLIHQDLMSNPELAYMLPPEKVKIIVDAHVKIMNVEIVKAATKKKSTSVKQDMRNATVDDF